MLVGARGSVARLAIQRVKVGKQLPGPEHEPFAGASHGDSPARSVEQRLPELALERLDPSPERLRRDEVTLRRTSEVELFGQTDCVPQRTNVHSTSAGTNDTSKLVPIAGSAKAMGPCALGAS